ncbi:hypothetical protein QVD17_17815 [Tagetes erecta]|uniref:Scarecrow-like protein 9 n=1 Tax=Tagetes erecta TaxID=13708 RepID=A0AAD8P1S4_TARER|nr:hypothetical protein QVD17_17815 [Tagetes erecta]
MDPRFGRSSDGRDYNLSDPPVVVNHNHNFRGIQFDHPTTSSNSLIVSSNEDCDLSDAILGFISQILMEEEDLDDKSCMLYDLQAAEKSFYEVIGEKYPPSPSYDLQGLYSDPSLTSSSNTTGNSLIHSPDLPSDIYDNNQMMVNFNKGFEEASKLLPNPDFNSQILVGSRVRKTPNYLTDDYRSIKQPAIFQDTTLRSNEIDLILLCSMGQGDVALRLLRNDLRTQTTKHKHKDHLPKGRGKTRAKNLKKQVIDLTTLLVACAQAVAADDTRNATELLKQIRQHASPFGDGNQRLAHCFANGLEARLAGTGTQIYRGLVTKKTSAADYIRAYYLYIASSPFRKISNFASNRTIMNMAENATRIHIIDFGILYGFQWPTLLQRISQRKGGPPRLRLTGIEFPQPGFRPAETIEETGARLKEYANKFNVPFEYNPIAKRWENVSIEDLKIDEGEFLVVNCMYRSKNLLDETVGVKSARNVVLDLIKKISPNIFIHGILNGSYNAPFFLTRFKEALFHFSALFDMLETNVPRERPERRLLEGEVFGREALNVIACEGWERIERPETYKQWHVRNLRAGFVSVPLCGEIIKVAEEKVGLYHKDFMIDVDNDWLLQGWKGRIIYAISCWKPA